MPGRSWRRSRPPSAPGSHPRTSADHQETPRTAVPPTRWETISAPATPSPAPAVPGQIPGAAPSVQSHLSGLPAQAGSRSRVSVHSQHRKSSRKSQARPAAGQWPQKMPPSPSKIAAPKAMWRAPHSNLRHGRREVSHRLHEPAPETCSEITPGSTCPRRKMPRSLKKRRRNFTLSPPPWLSKTGP